MEKTLFIILIIVIIIGTIISLKFIFNNEPSPLWDINIKSPAPQKNIIVSSPKANDIVNGVIKITGKALVFENQFNVRIIYNGKNIYEEGVMANAPDAGQFGDFEKEINILNLGLESPSNITLEVFDYSAKDGSEIDKVIIPLQFVKGETTKIKVYFNNSQLDPMASCNKVFPVEREILKTQSVARAALEELLRGSSKAEENQGFMTSINSGVKIQKLSIENGVAAVDFDNSLESQVGGSCRVSVIRAQITQTLKQFPSVKNVVISIDGRTEDILQP